MIRTVIRYGVGTSLIILQALTMAAAQDQRPASEPTTVLSGGATVSDRSGRTQVQLPGQPLASPARGQFLPPGTLLQTGAGRVLLRLDDGSQILVGPNTRLLLQQPGAGDWNYLQLLLGKIRAQIKKRTGGAPPFQLGTPSAVIAVRGTRFDVEVNLHNVTEVDVFDGLVEVAGRGVSGPPVLLEPGFSTRVGMDTGPEQPSPTEDIRPEIEPPGEAMESENQQEETVDQQDTDQDNALDEMEQGPDRDESTRPKPPQF